MYKVVVYFKGGYCNLSADEFHEDGEYIKVYKGSELVGLFKTASVDICYRSGKEEKR